ncbi:DegV family protein [Georgenia wangjunii]|uniref:DegV family protein n=1 Tax=Georgenia wangjunii TaxID=3117730 RepID=UPI002F2648F8
MAGVAVLTDSTASLPPERAAELGITVVPLRVILDGQDLPDDGVTLTRTDLASAMRAGATVTTSQPSAATFTDAMVAALDAGADAVVSLHISAELSGTGETARVAAAAAADARPGARIHAVDTRTAAAGTGLAAIAAAEVAAAGGDVERVLAAAREVAARSRVFFVVADLHHLARGGRIGQARAFVGSALGIRPILGIEAGRIAVLETVRGAARARRRLVEHAVRAAGGPGAATPRGTAARVRVAVHHFDAADDAHALATQVRERLEETGADVAELIFSEVTAVIGAHTGPGCLGLVVAPAGPAARASSTSRSEV